MADRVEEILQEMVPELDDLRRKGIFEEAEIRHIVRRRREFEYLLLKQGVKQQDFLGYIRYEVALESLRLRRSRAKRWRKFTISDAAGIKRMHFIFDRALKKFKGDMGMWYQYIDFCLRSGSTKMLSRVLLKCVKLHPREVEVWLLAADRFLKCGQIKAARTLLLRALRFLPGASRLWSEFFRLEVKVARNVQLGGASGAPQKDATETAKESASALGPWAPACLLLKRACGRLRGDLEACADFFSTAAHAVEAVRSECSAPPEDGPEASSGAVAGFQRLQEEVRTSLAELRPTGAADVAGPAVKTLWQLWWEQRRKCGDAWQGIAEAVAGTAPPAAVQHLAATLAAACVGAMRVAGEESPPFDVLLHVAAAPCATADGDTPVAILEALETCSEDQEFADKAAEAALRLLRGAVEAHPTNIRLRLLANQRLPPGERPFDIEAAAALKGAAAAADPEAGLDAAAAAQLLLASGPATMAASADEERIAALLRALAREASPRPFLEVYLAGALASGGQAEFLEACRRVAAVISRLWEAPRLRAEALMALLDVKLRAMPLAELRPKEICAQFEDLLTLMSDKDDSKVDVWLRYVEFVQRAAQSGMVTVQGMPTPMDLHWRAMRSVGNQTLYSERVHGILQSNAS